MNATKRQSQRSILNRLKRARGQLDAVIAAVEDEGKCQDVVTQLAAVSKALDRAGFLIISSAMQNCVENDSDAEISIEELEKLFLSLT